MKRILTALALTALIGAGVTATAGAKPLSFEGKTDDGQSMAFTFKGDRITGLSGYISVSCVPTKGSPQVRTTEFTPPGTFRPGPTTAVKDTQYMSWHGDVTKHYEVTVTKGKAWKVKLHVNYSFTQLLHIGGGQIDRTLFVCQGDDGFDFEV